MPENAKRVTEGSTGDTGGRRVDRRTVLTAAGAGGVTAVSGCLSNIGGGAGSVTYGVVSPITGSYSSLGPFQRHGAELAIKHVQESEDYDFDVNDRASAMEMMQEAESALHEGTVLTGRFYKDKSRPAYHEEKRAIDDMPETPTAELYHDEDHEWERSYDLIDVHK